jgi:regulator of RNase E activity RraB
MKKHLVLSVAILALALPGLSAVAEPRHHAARHQISAEDAAAFTNARIAALKAGLQLTPAQEKNWPALETALRDLGKARAERAAEWREKRAKEAPNFIEALRLRGKAFAARGADMEKLADAAKQLYDSLDDAQKRRFAVLLHGFGRLHGSHHKMMRHAAATDQDDDDKDDNDDNNNNDKDDSAAGKR